MKITYEAYGVKNSIETQNDDVTLNELLDYLQQLIKSAGFYPPEHSVLDFVTEDE